MSEDDRIFGIDPSAGHPERGLAIGYAPADRRPPLAALFALDATLARLARGTRDGMVAQMRLAWWREALTELETAPVAGHPILAALLRDVLPCGVPGAALAALVDGWEALIAGDVAVHGRDRGGALFAAAGLVLEANDPAIRAAGEGWALADLATCSPVSDVVREATDSAIPLLREACARRWSRAGRPLGALAHIARMDLDGCPIGSPGRIARLIRHRLTGG